MPPLHRPQLTRDCFAALFGDRAVAYAEARAAGFSRAALDAAVGRGMLVRPRRGLISVPPVAAGPHLRANHLANLAAALASVSSDASASHDSAALVHGIARPSSAPPSAVQLVGTEAASFVMPGLILRASPLPPHHRVAVDGMAATSIARTAVDLARGRPFHAALIPLDSAARLLIAGATATSGNALRHAVREPEHRAWARAQIAEALDSEFGWAGTVGVHRALPHLDPASESATESRSRGWFLEAGLGALNPGTPIRCGARTYWADFCSPEHRLIGEADGWSKYGDTAPEFRTALGGERERQRDLEADGWGLTRWTSTDRRRTVVDQMARALHPPA